MKIYQTTTIQYLTAETAGAEAGWYAVEAGMSPDQDGAVSALSDLGEGLSAAPVILNAASQEAALPAYLNAVSATYFAPAEGYRFDAKQATDIYNSVEFADGLTVAVATVTEYTSGASYSHSALTLTMTAANGQIFELHFEYADSGFSFGWGEGAAVDLESFVLQLGTTTTTETIQRGTENHDSIEGDWQDNDIYGAGGIDTIKGYGGDDTIWLEAGEAYGGEGDDVITTHNSGTKFNVSLHGDQGDDTLTVGNKNDFLSGGTGADYLDGGDGSDTATYTKSRKGVEIDLEAGTGKGGEAQGDILMNIENAYGSDHDDTFIGNEANNLFMGREGDDTFIASGGNDAYRGGRGGDDTIDYSGADAGISVDLHDYKAAKVAKGNGETDSVIDIEHVTGTEFDDEISGSNAELGITHGNNTLKGLGGNDTLRGEGGDDVL